METTVLYEDDDILLVNKPAGLLVHQISSERENSNVGGKENTLVDWILSRYPAIKGVGDTKVPVNELGVMNNGSEKKRIQNLHNSDQPERSGIVHRLDRDTSGVMVIAKTQNSFKFLKRLFQNREVHKKYHAFVWGLINQDRGTIDKAIGRSPSDIRRWSSTRGARGELRDAETFYRVISRLRAYPTPSGSFDFSFVEVQPRTGRTHQIRVHLKYIGHPVVSDYLYEPKRPQALGFKRTALHSREIKFKGRGGKVISAIAPYPDDFKQALAIFGIDASS